jgi:hypothetical protein
MRLLPQWLHERSYYMAGVLRAELLQAFRDEVAGIANGTRSMEESRRTLQDMLAASDYRPEPGQEGTIKDLRTTRRIHVSLRTNVKLLQGWATKEAGLQGQSAVPAWELVRFENRRKIRDWQTRFTRAGGKLYADRMIALQTSPVWYELGNGDEDSLGVDYPPFAWGSGMGWQGVLRAQCEALGVLPSGWKPPPLKPVSSPNATLETRPKVTDAELRKSLTDHLSGLAEWQGEKLVFTDPNGSRKYPAAKVAEVVTAKLPKGMPNLQAAAAKAWAENALENIKLRAGRDRVDDFVRLVLRTEPLAGNKPVWRGEFYGRAADLEARLEALVAGVEVSEVADSWSLLERVASGFASRSRLPYQLVLMCRQHGTLREIYPVIRKVLPKYGGQAEVIALEGTRFKLVGEPVWQRLADGRVLIQAEVEELST